MTTTHRYVTPLLWVGQTLPWAHYEASEAQDAYDAMKRGESALVADFETAEAVLRLLGLGEKVIEDRLHFAKTGQTLYAV